MMQGGNEMVEEKWSFIVERKWFFIFLVIYFILETIGSAFLVVTSFFQIYPILLLSLDILFLATIVFLSYSSWKDGERIKSLDKELESLQQKIAELAGEHFTYLKEYLDKELETLRQKTAK